MHKKSRIKLNRETLRLLQGEQIDLQAVRGGIRTVRTCGVPCSDQCTGGCSIAGPTCPP
ncbi:MAG TPA: hypothetical protein VHB47_13605 [Thermoanaerobaculia bacterium]|nr:hypothetical protein [Thermoanaerobaculia bacterium]